MPVDLKEKQELETKKRRSFVEDDLPKKIVKEKKIRDKSNLVSSTIELEPEFRIKITKFFKSQGFTTLKEFFEYLVKQEMQFYNLTEKEKYEYLKNKFNLK